MTEEQKALILHRSRMAKETLEDAPVLHRERRSRWSIVNRAYYAMFYPVLALLTFVGKTPLKHSGAIALFDKHFVKTGEFPIETSKWLHRAFNFRQRSNYRELYEPSAEQVEEILQWAKSFGRQVEAFLDAQLQAREGGH